MIIIPLEKPVITGLNSYYIEVEKLLEHFQGEFGAGAVHFKAPALEGMIYFDESDLVNSILQNGKDVMKGGQAAKMLIETALFKNFKIAVYKIDPEKLYYWAHIQNVEVIHENLSSEFTDLDGLLKKMNSENLTGYIDIFIGGEKKIGQIFYMNGTIVGSSLMVKPPAMNTSKKKIAFLLKKISEFGGTFNVNKIVFGPGTTGITLGDPKKEQHQTDPEEIIEMIQTFLGIFESGIVKNKKIKTEPTVLLKKKFIEKSDQYDFLDPFAAEFAYANGKVDYTGAAPHALLLKAVIESVGELYDNLGIQIPGKELAQWKKKHSNAVKINNIDI